MEDDLAGVSPLQLQRAANALVVVGFAVLGVSLVVPFASNQAGCLDHCADAQDYFVWHPLQNIGAPFLFAGVASSILVWRSVWRGRWPLVWLVGSFLGWVGLVLFYGYAPAVIAELYLYGGPELNVSAASLLVGVGWSLLWVGALVSGVAGDRASHAASAATWSP